MKQFCRECGKEARQGDRVCIHCGTPLESSSVDKSRSSNGKQPLSKKNKLILMISIGIVALIIGLSAWAMRYQSFEAVEQRFHEALAKSDENKLKSLMIHEDGSKVLKAEAEAFIKLNEENGYIDDLYTVVQEGKFLGVFKAYKIQVVSQFATYDNLVDGLSFEFNKEEFAGDHESEYEVVYGPLAPGIYDVEAVFSGKYGETNKSGEITLNDADGDVIRIPMEVPVSKVSFSVENIDEFDLDKAYIQLNKEKIKLNSDGTTKEVGPFILDGSQKIQVVVDMPWGKVVSKDIKVDEAHMSVYADLLSKEQFTGVEDTLKNSGEQYVESLAKKSTDPVKDASKEVKEFVQEHVPSDDRYYSGKFNLVDIDRNSIEVEVENGQPVIQIFARYTFEESFHDVAETPDLIEEPYNWTISLSYDEKKKAWQMNSVKMSSYWGDLSITDTVKGSNKLHGPSKETVANAKDQAVDQEIDEIIQVYTAEAVAMANFRDISYIEDSIVPGAPAYKQGEQLIAHVEKKNIHEQIIEVKVGNITKVDANTYNVTVNEQYFITEGDAEREQHNQSVIQVKRDNNEELKVYEILESKIVKRSE